MWLHRIPPNAAAAATGEALARALDPLLATVTTVRIGVGSFAAGESAARKWDFDPGRRFGWCCWRGCLPYQQWPNLPISAAAAALA